MGKNKKEIPNWAKMGHSKPVTRREFLAAGIIPFAASIVVPNWMNLLLGSSASAQTSGNCPTPLSLIPFITLNLQGGASLSSNFLPMNKDRQLLKSYKRLGLGNNSLPVEREFGNVPFAGGGLSKILVGLRENATATTLGKTAFFAIPCDSNIDTANNKFDVTGLITKAGAMGTSLPNLLLPSWGVGLTQSPAIVNPPAPLVMRSFNNMSDAVGYTADLGSGLTANQKIAVTKLMSSLTSSQTRKLASIQGGADVKKILDCAGVKNISVVGNGASAIDPRKHAEFSKVWEISETTGVSEFEVIAASCVYNTLLGNAGTSCLELGGYDYHTNDRTTGDKRDLEAGQFIGSCLQSAAVLGKPMMLYVTTDGGNSCPESDERNAPWTGDRGAAGMAYVIYFDPKGRPQTKDFQLGQFNDEEAADTTFLTGGNPEIAAAAVFANWCQANKRLDLFEKIAGRTIDASNLSKVLLFG